MARYSKVFVPEKWPCCYLKLVAYINESHVADAETVFRDTNPTKVGTTYWADQVQAEPVQCWITASNVDLGDFQPGTQSPAIAIPTTLVCDGDADLSVTIQSLEGKEILTFSPGVTGLMTVGRSSVSNTTKLSVKRYVSVDPLASVRLTVLPGAKPGAYEAYGVIYVTVQ